MTLHTLRKPPAGITMYIIQDGSDYFWPRKDFISIIQDNSYWSDYHHKYRPYIRGSKKIAKYLKLKGYSLNLEK